MSARRSFLTPEELDEFNKPSRRMSRRMTRILPAATTRDRAPLDQMLRERLRELRARRHGFFECVCIRAARGDGMTWSAESVARAFEERHDFDALARSLSGERSAVHRITGGAAGGELPPVAGLLGERRFLAMASSAGLIEPFISPRNRRTMRGIGFAIVAGAAVILLTTAQGDERRRSALANAAALAVAASAAAVLGGVFTRYIPTRTAADARRDFITGLGEGFAGVEKAEQKLRKLGTDISVELRRGPFPRWIVVDDWEGLDVVTQRAVQEYFKGSCAARGGAEMWVVFEPTSGERLSATAVEKKFPCVLGDEAGFERMTLYQQELLDEGERQQLARRTGRVLRSGATTVRQVCTDDDPVDEGLAAALLRDMMPRSAGAGPRPLDLLYLLALADTGEGPVFSAHDVEQQLFRDGDLAPVLKAFMGPLHSRLELHDLLEQLRSRYAAVLDPVGRDTVRFRVRPGVAQVLARESERLHLGPASLGHLFWACTRHAEASGRPHRAYGVRRLVRHCVTAHPAALPGELRRRFAERLLEVVIHTVRGALRTTLFEDVPALLRRARMLMQDAGLTTTRDAVQLRRAAAEAFAVTGDESLLADAARLPVRGSPVAHAADLAAYGLDLLPLAAADRAQVAATVLAQETGSTTTGAADLLRGRAGWLALSICADGDVVDMVLQRRYLQDPDVHQAFGNAEKRIARPRGADTPWLTDGCVIVDCLWNQALRAGATLARQQTRLLYEADPETVPEEKLLRLEEAMFVMSAPRLVAEMAERALAAASQLMAGGTRDPRGVRAGREYTTLALAREIALLAWAALLLTNAQLRYRLQREMTDAEREHAERVARAAGAMLNEPLTASAPFSAEAAASVDTLLSLSEMVWRTLGLPDRAEAVAVRRGQLASVLDARGQFDERMEALLGTLNGAFHHAGLHGLLAPVVVANVRDSAQEIRSSYASDAAAHAVESGLPAVVVQDFALYAVLLGHGVRRSDLLIPARTLLQPDAAGRTRVDTLLDGTPVEDLPNVFLVCLNAADRVGDEDLAKTIRQKLDARMASVPAGSERRELEAILCLSDVEHAEQDNGVVPDPQVVLQTVGGLREYWVYPWALRVLLRRSQPEPALLREAVAVLQGDKRDETFSTYYSLALLLSSEPAASRLEPGEREHVIGHLRTLVGQWEKKDSVEENLSVYRYLSRWDPERQEHYAERLDHWEGERVRRDYLLRFPQLARSGEFFLIFRDCVMHMVYWGLALDRPDLHERMAAALDERSAAVNAWLEGGAPMAAAFLPWPNDQMVAVDFVVMGYYLFSPKLAENPELDRYRATFNQEAYASLPHLLARMLDLPRVPQSVRGFLADYGARFQEEFLQTEGVTVTLA
jgi:hypothetical protein